ncbi:MAG: tyrosine-type recombinase/integrase [Polyangiaceae bacterium]
MTHEQQPSPASAVAPQGAKGDAPSNALAVVVHAPGGVSMVLPPTISDAGEHAARLTLEFFTARIPNPNTRKAYGKAVFRFCEWCQVQGVGLRALAPPTVAAYLKELQGTLGPASIKLTASALRHWLDFLTERGALPSNPALSVRTPRLVVVEGKTPVLEREDAKTLLASLDDKEPDGTPRPRTVVELRDRAAIAVMLYNWLRVEALCSMRVGDFVDSPSGAYLIAREKGGKERKLPAHHAVVEALRAYLEAGQLLEGDRKATLFQSAPARSGKLSGKRMPSRNMLAMVKRRCAEAGLDEDIGCHSLRATGITTHQENGGRIEDAARLAGHADVRTTALYDRSKKKLERSEVERVQF